MITNKTVKVPYMETRFTCCQKVLRNSWIALTPRRIRNLSAKLEVGVGLAHGFTDYIPYTLQ
jgi:hypothetical protein